MIRSLAWKDVARGVTDIFYPPTCVFCYGSMTPELYSNNKIKTNVELCDGCLAHIRGVAICNPCWKCAIAVPNLTTADTVQLADLVPVCCPKCEKSKKNIERLVVLGEYREILREAVIACKRMSYSPLAASLGDLIALKIREVAQPADFGAVTFVPSHWYRRMKRGGIPTREIARRVAAGLGVPMVSLLTNTRQTEKQGMLGDRQRRKNVSGAFGVKKGYALKVPRILIVDDVWTTGSTICEVAKQLRQGYDAEIWATVVARAIGSHVN